MSGNVNAKQITGILGIENGGSGNATYSNNELIIFGTQSFQSSGYTINDSATASSDILWTSEKIIDYSNDNYLSLNGGTVSGDLIVTGTLSFSELTGTTISATNIEATQSINLVNGSYQIGGTDPWREISSVTQSTTTSTTYSDLVTPLEIAPGEGTYLVFFSASGRGQVAKQEIQYSIFNNGVQVTESERDFGYDTVGGDRRHRAAMHTQAVVTVSGSNTVGVQFRTNTSTLFVFERSLILIKIQA